MRTIQRCRCVVALLRARLLLSLLPVRIALRLSEPRVRSLPTPHSLHDPLDQLALAASKIPGTTCLPRALAARRLMARVGRTGALVIGVRRLPDGRLDAHAWVEENGIVVIGGVPNLATFARLPLEKLPALFR